MAYTVDRFNSNSFDAGFPLTLADKAVNSSATSLKLWGRGTTNYGELMAENLVHMVEHFAGISAPANPITGQLWWQGNPATPGIGKMLVYAGNSIWKELAGQTASSSAPANPNIGDLWYNTSDDTFNVWTGVSWQAVVIGSPNPTNPGATAPSGPSEGDLWYDTANDVLNFYDGASWIPIQSTGLDVPSTQVSDDISGTPILITQVGGQILSIWTPTSVPYANLWNGTVPSGKPNLQSLFPDGLGVGHNYASYSTNAMRGRVVAPIGSVTNPGIQFTNDTNTGFYQDSADTLSIAAGGSRQMQANSTGGIFYNDWVLGAGATLEATYADLAEKYSVGGDVAPGELVSIATEGDFDLVPTMDEGDDFVFGVVSTDPAYKMNSASYGVYVAMTGRVPVKVLGSVSKGDRLVPAGNKLARSAKAGEEHLSIGRALEPGSNYIMAVVNIRT